jgi:hypothetical protein
MSDFYRLTKAQIDCMNYHAFNGYAGGKHGSVYTLNSLIKLGFLEKYNMRAQYTCGAFEWISNAYDMPIHIHIEWCAWVAKDVKEGDL